MPSPEPEVPPEPEEPLEEEEDVDTLEAHKQLQLEFWRRTNPKQYEEMTAVVRQNSGEGWENYRDLVKI